MKRLAVSAILLLFVPVRLPAQLFQNILQNGFYFQWGYNRGYYTKSDMHFKNGDKYNFTIYDVQAKDQPDFETFVEDPMQLTIPQNSSRLGFYLDRKQKHAIELNFDHAKYVMVDGQKLRLTGTINNEFINTDTIVGRYFIHLEHTNGANFLMLNYLGQVPVAEYKNIRFNLLWRVGAGVVVPRSDVILMGKRLDNRYHIAGYIAGADGGFRFYFLKRLYLEGVVKGGYANYRDVLVMDGGRVSHSFYFAEIIGTLGYDIVFNRRKKTAQPALPMPGEINTQH